MGNFASVGLDIDAAVDTTMDTTMATTATTTDTATTIFTSDIVTVVLRFMKVRHRGRAARVAKAWDRAFKQSLWNSPEFEYAFVHYCGLDTPYSLEVVSKVPKLPNSVYELACNRAASLNRLNTITTIWSKRGGVINRKNLIMHGLNGSADLNTLLDIAGQSVSIEWILAPSVQCNRADIVAGILQTVKPDSTYAAIYIYGAIKKNGIAIVRLLLPYYRGFDSLNIAYRAVERGCIEILELIIPFIDDSFGLLLRCCVRKRRADCARLILESENFKKICYNDARWCLITAAELGETEIVRMIISLEVVSPVCMHVALRQAASHGRAETLREFYMYLHTRGRLGEIDKIHPSPANIAALQKHPEAAIVAIEWGIEKLQQHLMRVVSYSNAETIKTIFRHFAKINRDAVLDVCYNTFESIKMILEKDPAFHNDLLNGL